jgi:hypothetical protein
MALIPEDEYNALVEKYQEACQLLEDKWKLRLVYAASPYRNGGGGRIYAWHPVEVHVNPEEENFLTVDELAEMVRNRGDRIISTGFSEMYHDLTFHKEQAQGDWPQGARERWDEERRRGL